ncbi:MAG: zinc ribbon domain-containing protein [Gammaproteobacteria bacterium]
MPIYEYVCKSCGHELDALQKMSEDPLTDCPECGESALKRKISAPRFRLKGSGWYETDFKSDKDKKRNLADGGEKPAGDGDKAGAKSDAKPDAKSDAAKGGGSGDKKAASGSPGGGEAA